jgi:hypothetical protein
LDYADTSSFCVEFRLFAADILDAVAGGIERPA